MSLNGRNQRTQMAGRTASPAVQSKHPALDVIPFSTPNLGTEAEPLDLKAQQVAVFGLGREYAPTPERARNYPGMLTLSYGGGFINEAEPLSNGFVDRARLETGLYYIWSNEIQRLPVSALPFAETGKPRNSLYGVYRRFNRRDAFNAAWWSVIGGVSHNTGAVAPTRPEPLSGVQQQPPPRFGQAPWRLPDYTLEVDPASTRPRTVRAISVMTPT